MKTGLQLTIILILFLAITSCQKPSSNIIYSKKYLEEVKASRDKLAIYMALNSIPGAAVAVSKNGELVYSEGIGWASKDFEVLATRNTKFRIGELSELFTSFIYLRMVEEGKLHPDSSIQNYFPEFPEKKYRINLKHLINQTSGIRESTSKENNWRALNVTLQRGLDDFKNDPVQNAPNQYQVKSMFNYNLLGAIMEKTTKSRFRHILKNYVTDTLKLTSTVIDNPLATIKSRTDFFDQNLVANVVHASQRDLRYRAPSLGILSTPEDLVKFGDAILNSDILSEKTKSEMFNPIPLYNGIPSEMANSWMLFENNSGVKFYGKSGNVTGGSASLLIYPEYGITVAFTSNLSMSVSDTPIFDIAGYFIDKE